MFLSINLTFANEVFNELSNVNDIEQLAKEAKNQQKYIKNYIKKHNENENKELFLKWRDNALTSLKGNDFYSFLFKPILVGEYPKTIVSIAVKEIKCLLR